MTARHQEAHYWALTTNTARKLGSTLPLLLAAPAQAEVSVGDPIFAFHGKTLVTMYTVAQLGEPISAPEKTNTSQAAWLLPVVAHVCATLADVLGTSLTLDSPGMNFLQHFCRRLMVGDALRDLARYPYLAGAAWPLSFDLGEQLVDTFRLSEMDSSQRHASIALKETSPSRVSCP